MALTAGLGVATFVKAFGVGFLARPRSDAAADGRERPRARMLAGMARSRPGVRWRWRSPAVVAGAGPALAPRGIAGTALRSRRP